MILLINKGTLRMNALRFAAIVLLLAFLVACGAGVDVPTGNQRTTLLHTAAMDDEPEVVALLLKGGADIEARNEEGATPLHVAAGGNKLEVVALLLDRGADVEVRSATGHTPLHFAAESNKPEVVALLLDRGADIEARNYDGPAQVSWKALLAKTLATVFVASFELTLSLMFGGEPDKNTFAFLSEFPDVIFYLGGIAPLHAAAAYNEPAVVALLLERGADIEALSAFGHTPLHHAAIRGTPEVFELLLDRGADIKALDRGTFTPLDYAVKNENLKRSSILERITATREPELIASEPSVN